MSTKDFWICSVCGEEVSRQDKELRVRSTVGWDHTRCHTSAVVQEPEELELLSVKDAQRITLEIKQRVTHVWELISQAYHRRAWSALGYESWDSYTEAEFGSLRLRLPREERTQVVTSLRESGLSIRAIAAATGHGVGTVKRDLDVAEGVPNGTPAVERCSECNVNPARRGDCVCTPCLNLDKQLHPEFYGGKTPTPEPPGAPTDSTPGMTDRVQAALGKATQTITGTDGKKYKREVSRQDKKPSKSEKQRSMIMRAINLVNQVRDANSIRELDPGIEPEYAAQLVAAFDSQMQTLLILRDKLVQRAAETDS